MLFIFTKKRVFECWEADLLSVSILPVLVLLVVGVRKRAVYKEYLVIGNKMYSPLSKGLKPKPYCITYLHLSIDHSIAKTFVM